MTRQETAETSGTQHERGLAQTEYGSVSSRNRHKHKRAQIREKMQWGRQAEKHFFRHKIRDLDRDVPNFW